MKGESNKRHHYVPQCYLNNFTSNGKSLWVYNKLKSDNKIYQQAISNICCKDDFYSLEGLCSDKLLIEKEYFSKNIEPLFSSMLKNIIDKGLKLEESSISERILTSDEKFQFAYLLAIQWFRTPYQQHNISKLTKDTLSNIIPIIKESLAFETGDETFRDLDVQFEVNPVVEQAKIGYLNVELLNMYAEALTANYWEFFISPTANVYTSDFPITVRMHVPKTRPLFEGLACYGSELTYPISKNICLVIWDKEFFPYKKEKDAHFTYMTDLSLNHFNTYRYAYANEVYCAENNFKELMQIFAIKGNELYAQKNI